MAKGRVPRKDSTVRVAHQGSRGRIEHEIGRVDKAEAHRATLGKTDRPLGRCTQGRRLCGTVVSFALEGIVVVNAHDHGVGPFTAAGILRDQARGDGVLLQAHIRRIELDDQGPLPRGLGVVLGRQPHTEDVVVRDDRRMETLLRERP